jgi:hypothetical protein
LRSSKGMSPLLSIVIHPHVVALRPTAGAIDRGNLSRPLSGSSANLDKSNGTRGNAIIDLSKATDSVRPETNLAPAFARRASKSSSFSPRSQARSLLMPRLVTYLVVALIVVAWGYL